MIKIKCKFCSNLVLQNIHEKLLDIHKCVKCNKFLEEVDRQVTCDGCGKEIHSFLTAINFIKFMNMGECLYCNFSLSENELRVVSDNSLRDMSFEQASVVTFIDMITNEGYKPTSEEVSRAFDIEQRLFQISEMEGPNYIGNLKGWKAKKREEKNDKDGV